MSPGFAGHIGLANRRQRRARQRCLAAAGSLPGIRKHQFWRLAAGEPRILASCNSVKYAMPYIISCLASRWPADARLSTKV